MASVTESRCTHCGASIEREPEPVRRADGVVERGDVRVVIPPVEAALLGALWARAGRVTPREVLMKAGWPGRTATRNALDVHMARLRRRLAAVDVEIRTVRSRGYLLEL